MSARTAFLVISSPHDGPTALMLTSSRRRPGDVGQGGGDLVGCARRRHRLGLDPDAAPSSLVAASVTLVAADSLVDGARGLVDRGLVGRDLPHGAALEVDAEVEAAGDQRHQADQDHDARDREPQLAAADEVEVGLAVVEPGPDRAARPIVPARHSRSRRPAGGWPAGRRRPRPRATPRTGLSVNTRLRASRMTNGRVKK